MDLPAVLRVELERALEGVAEAELAVAAAHLSARYRGDAQDSRGILADPIAARAYLATRMPATYAALRASLAAVAEARPDFAPTTALDAGAGPGTSLWALSDCWLTIADVALIEQSAAIREWGERLAVGAGVPTVTWHNSELMRDLPRHSARDVVTLSYVLGEIPPNGRAALIDRLWALTGDTLVIVEPGTPAGWARIIGARRRLIELGAHLIAPCPHAVACPLVAPGWCHFSQRIARSRMHRRIKGAELGWEDEKFSYIAASRHAAPSPGPRVLAPPRRAPGRVRLKLCQADGTACELQFSRRDGAIFKSARRVDWGHTLGSD